ncbi:MAG: ABC transporter ATP-binding protein [Lentisphaerae bacterium GWF2_52_8]|nr:MAG: ABC transporter ATP-binding protein [Lentisphaerae bacterium GWF2_52_8]
MLKLKGLHLTFNADTPNENRALQGVDLEIPEGQFLIVIGTNGSGKSTLQNVISGALLPDEGQIILDGADLTKWSEHRRARHIGRVFQNPFSGTAPSMSIEENLALAARRGMSRGLSWALSPRIRRDIRDRIASLNMGLEGRLDIPIGSLSGGQRQALTLLMATWRTPKLLLLDEHTAALDPKSAEKIIRLTSDIVESKKLTTLMVTHSMPQAAALGQRLVMIHRGRIVRDISGEEKRRLRPEDLIRIFEEIRLIERLDESAAQMLRENYL